MHKKTKALLAVNVDDLQMTALPSYEKELWKVIEARINFDEEPSELAKFLGVQLYIICRSVSIRRTPSAPAAAPAAESLHASTAVARATGWNNQLQRLPPAGPPAAPHRHRVRVLIG